MAPRQLGENFAHAGVVDWRAGEGTIEIHQMNPATAGLLKGQSLICGAVVKHSRLVHFALVKAHGLAVFEVNCGVKDHRVSPCVKFGR